MNTLKLSNVQELIIKDNKNGKNDRKRLIAFFKLKNGKTYKKKFGSYGSYTFFDGAGDKVRENYIKRHSGLKENWNDVFSAGSLSRYVLWQFGSRNEIEKFYNREFKIPRVKVEITKNRQ